MIAYFWKLVWSLFWSNCWSLFWSLLWSIFIPQIIFNFYSTNKFAKIFTKIFLNGNEISRYQSQNETKCFSIKNIFREIFLCVLFWIQKQNIYLKILLSKKVSKQWTEKWIKTSQKAGTILYQDHARSKMIGLAGQNAFHRLKIQK